MQAEDRTNPPTGDSGRARPGSFEALGRRAAWHGLILLLLLSAWLWTAQAANAQIKGDPTPPTATPTDTPTIIVIVTIVPLPSATPTETHTAIPTATATSTLAPATSPSPTSTLGLEGSPPATFTHVATPSATSTAAAAAVTVTPTPTAPPPTSTETETATGTVTSTATHSVTPTATVTATVTVTPTTTPTWLPPGPECFVKPGKAAMKLQVPYIHQVNDIDNVDGNWACGPTSIAMVLAYYGKLQPWQDYLTEHAATGTQTATRTHTPVRVSGLSARVDTGASFAPYVTNPFTYNGHTFSAVGPDPHGKPVAGLYGTICPAGLADWGRMAQVLGLYGLTSRQIPASYENVVAALKRGHPVIIGNGLTPLGHVLVAIGYASNNQLIVNDPYGNRFAAGYGANDGEGMYYAWDCMRVRNALEVVGVYPPPTATATVTPTATATSAPASLVSTSGTREPSASALLNARTAQKTAEAMSEEFSAAAEAANQDNISGESERHISGSTGSTRAPSDDTGSRRAISTQPGMSPWLVPLLFALAAACCLVMPTGVRRSVALRAVRVVAFARRPFREF